VSSGAAVVADSEEAAAAEGTGAAAVVGLAEAAVAVGADDGIPAGEIIYLKLKEVTLNNVTSFFLILNNGHRRHLPLGSCIY
jgi:hypothetical protein